MDPVSAPSVAAFAIQAVDFSAKVISKTVELSRSGGLIDNEELERVTNDLLGVSKKLEKSLKGDKSESSDNQLAVLSLGKECQDVASELLEALQELKSKVNQQKWKNFRQALLAVWRTEKIAALESRLDRFRQQLILRLLESLREQLQAQYEKIHYDSTATYREVGRYFLQHLQDTEKLHRTLVYEIETKLFEAIQLRAQESSVVLHPPKDRIKILSSQLLSKLDFPEVIQRQERIPEALQNTFEWVYKEPKPDQNWKSFRKWLACGNGIYWITGKPGSGKSTLMKFIHGDDRTLRHLREWSKDIQLISAGFYFWNSGTEIQMSNEGLLRSLLFQTLKCCPELIGEIFPQRWETLNLFGSDSRPWSLPEYLRAFRLLSNPKFSHLRFFFVIDGLDEFVGDHTELIGLVKEMALSKHIKICVASRPWVVFQEAFSERPSLMLQDLTIPDIELYVRTNFDKSESFSSIKRQDPEFAEHLFQEVANRSSGVFLWVRLVVQSLLQGISNGDRISDLRQRLVDLPGDLEALFHKILDDLEPRYKQHASEFFQIHKIHVSISALRLSFADEEKDAIWKDGKPVALTIDDLNFRAMQMKRRIDSRTKGLLEITRLKSENNLGDSSHTVSSHLRNQGQVQYLHRTVKDFIEQEDIWKGLTKITSAFDPWVSLCKALVLEVKTFDFDALTVGDLRGFVYTAMRFASAARPASHPTLELLLDSLNSLVSSLLKRKGITFDPLDPHVPEDHFVLFPIAIQMDLDFWIQSLLDRSHPLPSRKHFKPYISFAIEKQIPEDSNGIHFEGRKLNHYTLSRRCLTLLLNRGASVYEKQGEEPFWKYARLEVAEACMVLASSAYGGDKQAFHRWMDAIEIMAEYGADISSVRDRIPERKLKDIDRLHPAEMKRLQEVLKMRDDFSMPHFESPRIRVMERLKRTRFNPARTENSKRTRH